MNKSKNAVKAGKAITKKVATKKVEAKKVATAKAEPKKAVAKKETDAKTKKDSASLKEPREPREWPAPSKVGKCVQEIQNMGAALVVAAKLLKTVKVRTVCIDYITTKATSLSTKEYNKMCQGMNSIGKKYSNITHDKLMKMLAE